MWVLIVDGGKKQPSDSCSFLEIVDLQPQGNYYYLEVASKPVSAMFKILQLTTSKKIVDLAFCALVL